MAFAAVAAIVAPIVADMAMKEWARRSNIGYSKKVRKAQEKEDRRAQMLAMATGQQYAPREARVNPSGWNQAANMAATYGGTMVGLGKDIKAALAKPTTTADLMDPKYGPDWDNKGSYWPKTPAPLPKRTNVTGTHYGPYQSDPYTYKPDPMKIPHLQPWTTASRNLRATATGEGSRNPRAW